MLDRWYISLDSLEIMSFKQQRFGKKPTKQLWFYKKFEFHYSCWSQDSKRRAGLPLLRASIWLKQNLYQVLSIVTVILHFWKFAQNMLLNIWATGCRKKKWSVLFNAFANKVVTKNCFQIIIDMDVAFMWQMFVKNAMQICAVQRK